MFIFIPFDMIMSPGFWSALHGPAHLASMVMLVVASSPGIAGPPCRFDVTFTARPAGRFPAFRRYPESHYTRERLTSWTSRTLRAGSWVRSMGWPSTCSAASKLSMIERHSTTLSPRNRMKWAQR
jgi:hypothetical protein